MIFKVNKKSLKIKQRQLESVYRRRTDNAMAKKKVQKEKQRSTKHTYITKDRVTLKTGGEIMCYCRVNLVVNEERSGKCLRRVEHIRGHL